MIEVEFYKVTKEIALRSGVIDSRYRTKDGFFILNNRDLSRIRFTTEEYITGLRGVEKITPSEAQTLEAENSYKMGLPSVNEQVANEAEEGNNEVQESDSETNIVE